MMGNYWRCSRWRLSRDLWRWRWPLHLPGRRPARCHIAGSSLNTWIVPSLSKCISPHPSKTRWSRQAYHMIGPLWRDGDGMLRGWLRLLQVVLRMLVLRSLLNYRIGDLVLRRSLRDLLLHTYQQAVLILFSICAIDTHCMWCRLLEGLVLRRLRILRMVRRIVLSRSSIDTR